MNYSESMSKRQQRRKALNQRFRRMFLVALLMPCNGVYIWALFCCQQQGPGCPY